MALSITCLVCSHNKPEFIGDALRSVYYQVYQNWHCVVVDSGILYGQLFFDRFGFLKDRRFTLLQSHETDEIRRTKAMAPWVFNQCYRLGLVHGDLVCYLADDDIFDPQAFRTFATFFESVPGCQAMYASVDLVSIDSNNISKLYGERRADVIRGKCCNGGKLDCVVDYLQFCHTRSALHFINTPNCTYWPEELSTAAHADGVFMERIGEVFPVRPYDVKVGINRRTPKSIYGPSKE